MPPHKNYPLAALFAVTAFSGWTISDALLKLVRQDSMPQGQIMLISGLSGMAVIFLLCLFRGNIRRLQPKQWRGLFGLGLCQWLSFVCWVQALPYLPLANMYVVVFLTPMTVACLATLILKEYLGWKRAIPIATGFVGVVVAVDPMHLMEQAGAWLPYLSLFGSMIGTASQMLLLRAVGKNETSECMSFYPRFVLAAVGLFMCSTSGFVEMKPAVFLSLCAAGALGSVGWALLSQAYKNAAAAAVAPFHYSQMITGALLGFLIWGDIPNGHLIAGAVIIITSGILLVRHERRVSRMMVRVE